MQAALCISQSCPFHSLTTTKNPTSTWRKPHSMLETTLLSRRISSTKLMAISPENSTVDYSSSKTSVFPAEACETIGGDACNADIYPEAKLKPEDKSTKAKSAQESVDRDYVEYSDTKTVFPAEACDDLGGEFCQPEYQKGVY